MPLETHQIARLRNVTTRSISPENFGGAEGGGGRAIQGTGAVAARDLGVGWKISPSMVIASGTAFPMGTIDGPGMITHVWLTTHRDHWRTSDWWLMDDWAPTHLADPWVPALPDRLPTSTPSPPSCPTPTISHSYGTKMMILAGRTASTRSS